MTSSTSPAPAAEPSIAAAAEPDVRTLRSITIRGSMWTVGGYGFSMALRMGSNLILTRLLYPEAFGVMALVNVFIQGLEMFSDLGIRVSIIQNDRGADPAFLNTAWTIQILRGFALWLCSCLIAWPVAAVYGLPELKFLIPVAAFASVITGFQSTSLSTQNRELHVARITVLMFTAQLVGTVVMVLWAWHWRSVWPLVSAALVNGLVRVALSHVALPGIRNRFQWDPEARKALFGFGKWVFLSTAFTFLADQSDRLWLGKFMDSGTLGVFSVAVTISGAATVVLWEMCQWVLMPVFSRIHREDEARDKSLRLRESYHKVRGRLDPFVMPSIGLLIAAGDIPVHVLWDARYAGAGWMLQVLAVGLACFYTLPFAWCCQVVWGDLRWWLWGNIGRTVWLLGVPLVWHGGGLVATVWYVALSQIPPLVFAWLRLRRDGIVTVRCELAALGYLGLGLGAGFGLKLLLASAGVS